jgi:D-aspartate ligase
MSSINIIPVIIGADLNAYNIARAFHEAYRVKSHVFGRFAVSATKYSSIVKTHLVPDLTEGDGERLAAVLDEFSRSHPDASMPLFGCTDEYVLMIIDLAAKGRLDARYAVPYTSPRCRDLFAEKAFFYAKCDKYGVPYPKTLIISEKSQLPSNLSDEGFSFPLVIKPSSSAEYWRHPFDGMKKAYFAETQKDAEEIISRIYASGYPGRIIIQKHIPGGDDGMRVLTTYSDKTGHVSMMCLGHVLLEEHTPKGIGNHSAIITEYNPSLTSRFRAILDGEGYTGFCNFDIKFDKETGEHYAFDMNLRQGRSNYYVTAAGENIARLVVDDLIEGIKKPFHEVEKKVFWHSVPRGVIRRYTKNPELVASARLLAASGDAASSYMYAPDLLRSPLRFACVLEMGRRQYGKYKKYCKDL